MVGADIPLNAAAAVLLGGTSFLGGVGGVSGTAVGVLFIGTLQNGLAIAGVQSFWQQVVTGVDPDRRDRDRPGAATGRQPLVAQGTARRAGDAGRPGRSRMSDDLEVLWQPLKLRGATLPNRIMTTATTVQYGVAGMVNERHLHFYRERARGGVGLMFTEQLTATPLSDTGSRRRSRPTTSGRSSVSQQVREALDPYPTRFFGQLVAGGATAASTGGLDVWGPARGPSDVGMAGRREHAAFSRDEIDQVVADYARSAANVKAAGLHGVEVHGSHGWLIGQFLSPFYNRRDDEYGGQRREPLPLRARDRHGPCAPRWATSIRSARAHLRRGDRRCRHHARGHARAARGARPMRASTTSTTSRSAPATRPISRSRRWPCPRATRSRPPRAAKQLVGDRAAVFVAGRIVDLRMAARRGGGRLGRRRRDDARAPRRPASRAQGARGPARRTRRRAASARTSASGARCARMQVTCVLTPATGREATLGRGHDRAGPDAGQGDRDRGRPRRPAHCGDGGRARARGHRARARSRCRAATCATWPGCRRATAGRRRSRTSSRRSSARAAKLQLAESADERDE